MPFRGGTRRTQPHRGDAAGNGTNRAVGGPRHPGHATSTGAGRRQGQRTVPRGRGRSTRGGAGTQHAGERGRSIAGERGRSIAGSSTSGDRGGVVVAGIAGGLYQRDRWGCTSGRGGSSITNGDTGERYQQWGHGGALPVAVGCRGTTSGDTGIATSKWGARGALPVGARGAVSAGEAGLGGLLRGSGPAELSRPTVLSRLRRGVCAEVRDSREPGHWRPCRVAGHREGTRQDPPTRR
ncbi:hypothetical protein FB475_1290 [Kribbella jejuensis]|uniref:Uncharacterized protein n=1 Tax=Kribbella jejuensis TaxID=236068 RepID=A0A542EPN3_9ACTN|nr:hypothetical protein FB475_1290 [Kribbella jejuensis]